MRFAVIDLGTNTFNLLIAEIENNSKWKEIYSTKMPVKLGEGGIEKRLIIPPAIERATGALNAYNKIIKDYQVVKIFAFATSAVRGASNQKRFVERLKERCNIDIKVISGEQEAEYIYLGVKEAIEMDDSLSLIMDIGGGSTEFIIANKHTIFWKHSFLLGVSRLIEKFNPSDPITPQEQKMIITHLEKRTQLLADALKEFPVKRLLGSSGSFDTYADLIVNRFSSPAILEGKNNYQFNLQEFEIVHQELLLSSSDERMRMKGMINMRVDMIVVASMFTHLMLKKFNINEMWLSTYSMKEGVISSILHSK